MIKDRIRKLLFFLSESLIFCLKLNFFGRFLKIHLFPLFKEQCERIAQVAHQIWAMWANRSDCSLKMIDCERIAQVAHQKWANERIACYFWVNRSFLSEKWAIRSENQWANSQPCSRLKGHAYCTVHSTLQHTVLYIYLTIQKGKPTHKKLIQTLTPSQPNFILLI